MNKQTRQFLFGLLIMITSCIAVGLDLRGVASLKGLDDAALILLGLHCAGCVTGGYFIFKNI